MRKTAAGVIAAAVLALAACSSAPAARTTALPLYKQAPGFTCKVTGGGTGVTVRVPGDGHKARLSAVVVQVNDPAGRGRFDHVMDVRGGTVPAAGMTLRWDDPGVFGLSRHCKVTNYLR